MRAIALAILLLAGCTGGPGASPAQGVASSTTPPTTPPTASPAATPVSNAVYTAADEAIAELIRAGAGEAIPRLKELNDMDPDKLEDLFVPLGIWITNQETSVAAYTPSGCTADAVAMFIEGIDAYDNIRERFLAWRDWGANGHAFHPEAPRQAAALFDDAIVELEAHCPA